MNKERIKRFSYLSSDKIELIKKEDSKKEKVVVSKKKTTT